MLFTETALPGVYLVDPEPREDSRGFFARAWCREEFAAHGLATRHEQTNLAFNHTQGTLRGLHYQAEPHAEAKLVRVTRGAVWDVAVDVRPDSPTYRRWVGVELTAESRRMLYVPAGFAHGYLTLADGTELLYQVSAAYAPQAERGLRYNDPALSIAWPEPVRLVSDKDLSWSLLNDGGAR